MVKSMIMQFSRLRDAYEIMLGQEALAIAEVSV
jgi:hypothetical protein